MIGLLCDVVGIVFQFWMFFEVYFDIGVVDYEVCNDVIV